MRSALVHEKIMKDEGKRNSRFDPIVARGLSTSCDWIHSPFMFTAIGEDVRYHDH